MEINDFYRLGTQVLVYKNIFLESGQLAHSPGSPGTIVGESQVVSQGYQVQFLDGLKEEVYPHEMLKIDTLDKFFFNNSKSLNPNSRDLNSRIIYQCVVGSRSYGLEEENSDTDRKGIFLPSAESHWSLSGVPDSIKSKENQDIFWEIGKFIELALKGNPTVLECLYSPIVERATLLAKELLFVKKAFLSKLIFKTYSGFVDSHLKKLKTKFLNNEHIKGKYLMHLARLLISGIDLLNNGDLKLDVGEQREMYLSIKHERMGFHEIESWINELQSKIIIAHLNSKLPEFPNYELVNAFLIKARKLSLQDTLP